MKHQITFLALLFCLSSGSIYAQNIQLIMNPNPSPYFSDWQDRTETATLIISNSGFNDIQVKVKTELYDGKGSLVAYSDDSKMPVLKVPQGSYTYYVEDIFPSIAINFKGNLAASIARTGRIPEDNYRICVALIDPKSGEPVGSSGTVCKIFNIVAYQAPVLIKPWNNEEIPETGIKGILFQYTPVTPSPNVIVTYRLQIWEVLPGQEPMTALRVNQPLVEKDLKGMLQTQWPIDFLLPEAGMRMIWTVTPLDEEDRKLVDGDGIAEPFVFSVGTNNEIEEDKKICIELISPGNGMLIKTEHPDFLWLPNTNPKDKEYTLKIVEVKDNQSPEAAMKENPAFFEREGIITTSFQYPKGEKEFEQGMEYCWTVTPDQVDNDCNNAQPFRFSIADECLCAENLTYDYYADASSSDHEQILSSGNVIAHIAQGSKIHPVNFLCTGSCLSNVTYDLVNTSQGTTEITGGNEEMVSNYIFTTCESYKLTIHLSCGMSGVIYCPEFNLFIQVDCPPDPCTCDRWDKFFYKRGEADFVYLDQNNYTYFESDPTSSFEFKIKHYCAGNCPVHTKNTIIYNPDGTQYSFTEDHWNVVLNEDHNVLPCGIYKVEFNATCGDEVCESWNFFIKIPCNSCTCGNWDSLFYMKNNSAPIFTHCDQTFQADYTDGFQFNFYHYCNPINCPRIESTTIYYPDGSIYSITPGLVNVLFNIPNAPHPCGLYKVVFRATCGDEICDSCILHIQIDQGLIEMYDIDGLVDEEIDCVESGIYTFKLNPSLPVNETVTYSLVALPANTIVQSGTFSYSIAGQQLSIPYYDCDVTSFKLTYTWYGGSCEAILDFDICEPPCCKFIFDSINSISMLSGVHFTNTFFVSPPGATILQVKVQILEISVNGQPDKGANILVLNVTSPSSIQGDPDAITEFGDALWFPIPLVPAPITGILSFTGSITNLSVAPSQMIKLKLRYTFYKDGCNEEDDVICEKVTEFNFQYNPSLPVDPNNTKN